MPQNAGTSSGYACAYTLSAPPEISESEGGEELTVNLKLLHTSDQDGLVSTIVLHTRGRRLQLILEAETGPGCLHRVWVGGLVLLQRMSEYTLYLIQHIAACVEPYHSLLTDYNSCFPHHTFERLPHCSQPSAACSTPLPPQRYSLIRHTYNTSGFRSVLL